MIKRIFSTILFMSIVLRGSVFSEETLIVNGELYKRPLVDLEVKTNCSSGCYNIWVEGNYLWVKKKYKIRKLDFNIAVTKKLKTNKICNIFCILTIEGNILKPDNNFLVIGISKNHKIKSIMLPELNNSGKCFVLTSDELRQIAECDTMLVTFKLYDETISSIGDSININAFKGFYNKLIKNK